MAKKRESSNKPDSDHQERNEESSTQTGEVVCPCWAGWEAFEKNVRFVLRQLKAGSHSERAYALHVFHDAMRIQSQYDLEYALEPGEHLLDEKRACNFRSMEQRIEAKRDRTTRRRKRL